MSLVRPVNQKLKDAYLECHGDGHQWRHEGFVGAPEWTAPFGMQGAIARHSICTNCGCERARWLTRRGEVQNRYKHPDGYLHKRSAPDDYAPSRLEYRRELAETMFAQFEEALAKAPRKAKPAAS